MRRRNPMALPVWRPDDVDLPDEIRQAMDAAFDAMEDEAEIRQRLQASGGDVFDGTREATERSSQLLTDAAVTAHRVSGMEGPDAVRILRWRRGARKQWHRERAARQHIEDFEKRAAADTSSDEES